MIQTNNITIDDIKRAIHTVDLINRPLIVFAQPSVIKALKEITGLGLKESKEFLKDFTFESIKSEKL